MLVFEMSVLHLVQNVNGPYVVIHTVMQVTTIYYHQQTNPCKIVSLPYEKKSLKRWCLQ